MNFKDAYKSYNDEIKSNPEVLKAVLDTDIKPRFTFNYRYAVSFAAMIALVVSVSVFSYNTFYKEKEPTVRYIAANNVSKEVSNIEKAVTVAEKPPVAEIHEADTVKGNEVKAGQSKSPNVYTPKKLSEYVKPALEDDETSSASKTATVQEEVNSEVKTPVVPATEARIAAPVSPYYSGKAYVPAYENTDVPSSDDGEIAVASAENTSQAESEIETEASADISVLGVPSSDEIPQDNKEYMSYTEYAEYIGFDIQSRAKLPDDMIFEPMPSAEIEYEEGVIVSDMFTASAFSVENPERNLSVSITKNGPQAGGFTEEISYAYSEDSQTVLGAYTEVSGVSVSVGVNNVTKTELDTFMNSLK